MTQIFRTANLPDMAQEKQLNYFYETSLWFTCIGSILYFSTYIPFGFDFTDESFAINWIMSPHNYKHAVTFFGYIYNPIFSLLNESIIYLRYFNFFSILLCGFFLNFTFLEKEKIKLSEQVLLSLQLSFAVLMPFRDWLLTPNYNSLNLISIILATIFTHKIYNSNKESPLFSSLLGISFSISFFAKPTSAILLALACLSILFMKREHFLKNIVISISTTLISILTIIYTLIGSVSTYIEKVKNGLSLSNLLKGGHEISHILRIDSLNLTNLQISLSLIMVVAILILCSKVINSRNGKILTRLSILTAIFTLILCLIKKSSFLNKLIPPHSSPFLFFIAAITITTFIYLKQSQRQKVFPLKKSLIIISIGLIFNYIYFFGSNNNSWVHGGSAAIFWQSIGTLIILYCYGDESNIDLLRVFSVLSLLISLTILHSGMQLPYRQAKYLKKYHSKILIGKNSQLMVSEETAQYSKEINKIIKNNSILKNANIIDLTGHSPGTILMLEGEASGAPWIIGGYEGSYLYAKEVLKELCLNESKELIIITEPDGHRMIDPEVLSIINFSLSDFQKIGEVKSSRFPYIQSIYKMEL